jgi:hypothetical protein
MQTMGVRAGDAYSCGWLCSWLTLGLHGCMMGVLYRGGDGEGAGGTRSKPFVLRVPLVNDNMFACSTCSN